MPILEFVSLAIVFLPPAYVYSSGRRLVSRLDDPAFPELRFSRSQRVAKVVLVCLLAALLLSASFGLAKAGVAILGAAAADFPSRRRIFEEGWGFFAYLGHVIRFLLAFLGAWLLLALTPLVVENAGAWGPSVGLALAVTVFLWLHFNARIMPGLMGARPLARPELEAEFERVIARARVSRPSLWEAGVEGGHFVNGFALPSVHRPGVLLASELIDGLTPSECTAILAHELAHLEHFTPRRMLARELLVALLLFALLAVVYSLGPDSATLRALTWIWPVGVLVMLGLMAARSQSHEHESDVRAVELTGDAESVISALTKIHAMMRMPRRWRAEAESRLSHPSLAHRIRAIREFVAGEAPAPAEGAKAYESLEPVALRSASDDGEAVVLASERVHWLKGIGSTGRASAQELIEEARDSRAILYDELRDLRLDVAGFEKRYLTAVDSRGKKLRLRLHDSDIAIAKAALERVESKLTSGDDRKRVAQRAATRKQSLIYALLGMIFALLPPISLPFGLSSLLVALRTNRTNVAVAGAIGIGAAVLGYRGPASLGFDPTAQLLTLACTLVIGSVFLHMAWLKLRDDQPVSVAVNSESKWALIMLAVLGVLYLPALISALRSPLPGIGFHLWARHSYGMALVVLGFSALIFVRRGRSFKPAWAALALALMLSALGSSAARYVLSDDPLVAPIADLPTDRVEFGFVRERFVEGSVNSLRLSPGGDRFAAQGYFRRDSPLWEDAFYGFLVERRDADPLFLPAVDLDFVDDNRVAVIDNHAAGWSLRVVRLEPDTSTESTIELPELNAPDLELDPSSGDWRVSDLSYAHDAGIIFSGTIGGAGYDRSEFAAGDLRDGYVWAVLPYEPDAALVMTSHWRSLGLMALDPWNGRGSSLSGVLAIADGNVRQLLQTTLALRCVGGGVEADGIVCSGVDDDAHTWLHQFDPESHEFVAIGRLEGSYYDLRRIGSDLVFLSNAGATPVVVDVNERSGSLVEFEQENDDANQADGGGEARRPGFLGILELLSRISIPEHTYGPAVYQPGYVATAEPSEDGTFVKLHRAIESDEAASR